VPGVICPKRFELTSVAERKFACPIASAVTDVVCPKDSCGMASRMPSRQISMILDLSMIFAPVAFEYGADYIMPQTVINGDYTT
jgi:hypothetical protein